MKREIGYEIRNLNNLIDKEFNTLTSRGGDEDGYQSRLQGWIIGYIHNQLQLGKTVYQKDIENEFNIKRPTVTQTINAMVRSGYIVRESVAQDARLRKLVLTDKALNLNAAYLAAIDKIEKTMSSAVSRDELDTFFAIVDKKKNNIEKQ